MAQYTGLEALDGPMMGGAMSFSMPSVDDYLDLDNFLDSYLTQQFQLQNPDQAMPHQPSAEVLTAALGAPPVIPNGPETAASHGLGIVQSPGTMAMNFQQPPQQQFQQPQFQPHRSIQQPQQPPLQNPFQQQAQQQQYQAFQQAQQPQQAFQQPQTAFQAQAQAPPQALDLMASMGMGNLQGMQSMQGFPEGLASLMGTAQAPLPLRTPPEPAAPTGRGGRGGRGAPGGRGGRGGCSRTSKAKAVAEPDLSSSDPGDSSDGGSSGAEAGKPRKKQQVSSLDSAERKHQALQEKNRRAQRRFRERQKTKLSELHKQIDELTGKVGTLQSENQALHSRTSILEKVLDMRNEQIQVMQETKEAGAYPGTEEELAQLQDMGGGLVQLTPDMIKELGSDQIYKIYQMYVKELSLKLQEAERLDAAGGVKAEGDPAGAEISELDNLVKDLSLMIMRLGVVKPLETRKFIVVSRQYLGSTEAEVINLWKNVMKIIKLSEQQMIEIVSLKRMFLQKIEPIMEERKHLNIQIQANLPHDTFHTKNALTYIKAHEAVMKLRDNLRAEQHVVLEFAIAVFRGVVRPRQMATLLVKCYPAVPDALGIASALAAELGEPDAPAARHLAMQLGGYLERAPSLGTHALTIGTMGTQPPAVPSSAGRGSSANSPGNMGQPHVHPHLIQATGAVQGIPGAADLLSIAARPSR